MSVLDEIPEELRSTPFAKILLRGASMGNCVGLIAQAEFAIKSMQVPQEMEPDRTALLQHIEAFKCRLQEEFVDDRKPIL